MSCCHCSVRSPEDHISGTAVWTSWSACIQSSSTQFLGVCAFVKPAGDSRAFFPLCQQLARDLAVCLLDCQIPGPSHLSVSGTQGRISPITWGYLYLFANVGPMRIKDEWPPRAQRSIGLWCLILGKGPWSARLQLETRPLHPLPPSQEPQVGIITHFIILNILVFV